MNPGVTVEQVSKKFCRKLKRSMAYGLRDIGRNLAGFSSRSSRLRSGEFWAVDDVSFALKQGEILGIMGPNGSGKSTLLKMLSGIYWPDKGRITTKGRVGALIEVGAGFHPLLTGKENIYVNGAILGMTQREIASEFDKIVAFADIGDFLNTPVKNYSSGMFVRLGFAIAVHCNPEILLIDEVLAVGDIGFRSKCYNKISELQKNSIIIFVSHNLPAISRISSQCLVLNKGKMAFVGETKEAIEKYIQLFDKDRNSLIEGAGEAAIMNFVILGSTGIASTQFSFGESITIEFDLSVSEKYSEVIISIDFFDNESKFVAQCHSMNNQFTIKNDKKKQKIKVKIPQLCFNPGDYTINLVVYDKKHARHLGWFIGISQIKMKGGFFGGSNIQFKADWSSGDAIVP